MDDGIFCITVHCMDCNIPTSSLGSAIYCRERVIESYFNSTVYDLKLSSTHFTAQIFDLRGQWTRFCFFLLYKNWSKQWCLMDICDYYDSSFVDNNYVMINNLRINKHWSIDQTNCKENECWILGSILFRSPTHLLRHWRRHCIASSGRIRWMDHLSKKCTVPSAAASLLLLLYQRAPPTNQTQVHLTIEFLLLSCLSVVPLIAIEITHIHTRSYSLSSAWHQYSVK